MPRKKKQQSGKPVVGASGKHSKHRNHASDGPIKGQKGRDKEGGRQQSLRYLQEMFSGKLDPMVVHMIMEDYNYNVDLALEVLFPLSGDAGDKERFEEGAKTALVGYNDSEEESEDEEEECEDPAGAGGLVAGRSEGDHTRTGSTGVGLDDFSIPLSKVKGLDMAIILADQLDRNTFAEESVQQILKGFKAYQRSGDRKDLEQLGNLSAIGEMLLEKGVAEEEKKEKEAVQAAKMKVKHVHSRLPVYSVTDDRLIGGMSSCSSSESDSAQASGDEDDRGNDNPTPLSKSNGTSVGGNQSSEWYDQKEAQHEDSTAQLGTKTECEHCPDDPDRVWTGSSDVTSRQASSRPDSTGGALLADSTSCETSKIGSIKDDVRSRAAKESSDFGLNESVKFTDDRSITFTNKYEEQISHTPTQDIALESYVVQDSAILNKPERTMEWQTSERIPAEPKTQPRKSRSLDETFTFPSSHRDPVVFPTNTQSAFMSQGPAVSHPAKFIPAFGFNTLEFSKTNITTGLLPRISPYSRSQFTFSQVHDNPAYSEGIQQTSIFQDSFGGQHMKPGFHLSYPPYSAPPPSSVGMPPPPSFTPMPNMEVPPPYFDQIDRQVVEPIFTSTMVEEEMGSPQRWPMIPHTNLKRSQLPLPSQSQKTPPRLPPGKVLCLMRGCPGSGKSFLARKLVGNGVILSTDDYFMVNGEYQYDIQQVGEAHDWNRERAKEHLEKGTTPIIIDNTNIMRWEMKPYVAMALKDEYQVVFMESDSPWRNKVGELAKRNSHGVPRGAIARMLQNFEHDVTVESVMNAPDKKKKADDVHDLYAERTDKDKRNGKKPEREGEETSDGREGRENTGEGAGTENQSTGGNKDVSVTEDGSEESAWETVGKKKVEHTRGHRGNQKNGQRTRGGRGGENLRGSPHHGSPKRRGQNRDRTHDMGKQPEKVARLPVETRSDSPNNAQRLGDSPKRYGMKRNNQSSPGPEADRHQQGRQARVRSSPRKGTKVGGKNAEQSPKLEKRNVSQISQGERGFPADKSGREREALSQFEEAVEFLANTESINDPMTRLVADIRANSMDAGTVSAREAAWTDDNPWQIFPSHPSQKSVQYSKRSQGRRRETAITKTSSNITHSSHPAEANPPMNVEDIEQESCDRVSETGRSQQNVSEEIKSGKTGGVEEKTLPLTDWSDGEINGDFYLNEWEIDHSKPRPARKVDQRNKQRKTDSNSVHQDTSPIETTKLDDINQPPDRLAEEEFSSEIGTCDASLQEERTDQFGAQKALNDCPADLGAPNGESSDKATSSQVHQSARCTTPSQSRPFRRSSSGGKSSRRIAAVFTSPAEVPKVDWSINDPSKSIPKPTFPVSRQKSLDQEKDVKTAGTTTDARDFVILHNIVSGSSSVSDLPTGYSFKSVTITPQDKPDTEFLLEGNDGSASAPPSSPSSSPIPHSLKLHKSCMTEEIEDVDTSEEDKVAMMKVCFPDASPSDLESILDTCKGDVQWATNILLDSYGSANISPAMGGLVVEAASDVGSESVCTNIPLTSQDISSDRTKSAAQHDISENDKRLGQVNEGEGSEVEETGTDKVEQSRKSDSESLPSSAHGRVDNSDGNREEVEQVAGDNLGIETNNRLSDDDHVGGGEGDKECSQNRSGHDLTAPKILTASAEEHAELTLGNEEQSGEVTRTENAKESEEQNEDDEGESSSSEEFSNNFATGVTETSCSKTSTRCDSEVICSETSTSHDTGTISSQTSTSCDNEAIHSKTLTACNAEVICSETPSSFVTETICSKIASNSETAEDDMPELESSVDAQMMRNKLAALSDKSGIGGVGYLVKIADTCNQASLGTGSVVSQSSNAAVVCEDGVSRTDEKEDSNARRDEVGTSNEQTCQDLPEGNDKNEAPKTTHEGIPGEIVISDRSTESSSTPPGRGEEDAVQDGATSESLTRTTDAHLSSCVRPFDEIEKVTRQGDTLPVVVENRRDLSDSLCTPDFDSAGGINASELREGQSNTSDVCSGLFSTVSGIKSMVRDVSDSDIPWKEEYISPGEKTPKDDGKGKDTLQDPQEESGRSVYDYFGGMVLQMDAAFALQLQELFGPVGFHMQPDALSDDDLKVSIDYTTAKKLHAALSQGLKERFQSQETHLEDMLKRDEELARRLQQEENLKKLVKSHKNKTGKASAPWSPKTRKKKEVAGIGGVTGRGMGQMGEGELTGRIQPPPVQRTVVPELAKIMAEEEEKERAEKQEVWNNGNQERGSSIATKLKREQLYEAYPDVDKSVLEEIFKANSYDLRHTKWEVNAVYREPAEPVKNVYSPGALERMQRRRQNSPARQKVDGDDSSDGQFQSREQPDYDDYRAEASLHYRQRDECFKKAAKAYHSGQKELALHYSNQGRLHSMQLKEANVRAAALIVQQRRQETGEDKLDLHNLHLEEALQVLQEVLMEKEQQWSRRRVDHGSPSQNRYLEVVTGRGKHSHGGIAKLRPAVETFLQQRGYRFSVTNAGCFRVYLQ